MSPSEATKKRVGIYAADLVRQDMTIGLGTGSTVRWLVEELATRVRQGLRLQAVPTSIQTAQLAQIAGIGIADLNETGQLALTIDGADEIDPQGQLIKGGGGALLREKIVAAATSELIIIADESKLADGLGRFPLPIEVIPFGYRRVMQRIKQEHRGEPVLRMQNGQPFITDQGHYILDCAFGSIADPGLLNRDLHLIPGVAETGLFIDMASKAIIGYAGGGIEVITYR